MTKGEKILGKYLDSITIEPNIINKEGDGIYQTGYYIDIVDEYSMVLRKETKGDVENQIIFDIPLDGGKCLVLEGYEVIVDYESIAIQNEKEGLVADIPLISTEKEYIIDLKGIVQPYTVKIINSIGRKNNGDLAFTFSEFLDDKFVKEHTVIFKDVPTFSEIKYCSVGDEAIIQLY